MAISIPIITDLDSKGIDRAIREFKKLETTGQKAAFAIKKAAVPAGIALAGLAVVGMDAVKAFMADDKAARILAKTLQNTTGATDAQIKATEEFITQTSIAAAVADDELRPALDKLVRGTKDITEAQKLLNLALDISAGTGKDLGAVSDALSKAYNGQLGPLKKLDPALASLVANGATADEVFAALNETFGGQAAVAAGTAEGSMKKLGIQVGELKESIGASLMPIIDMLVPKLLAFAQWAQNNPEIVKIAAAAIVVLTASIVAMNIAMALNPFVAVGAAVALLATGVGYLYLKFEALRPLILGLITGPFGLLVAGFEYLRRVSGEVVDWIGKKFGGLTDAITGPFKAAFNGVARLWNSTIGKFSFKVPDWVPGIGGRGFDMPDIPMLAEGGITTGPTLAMIGERGPEAVIPLSKLGNMGGSTNITINVNGGDPNSIVRALQQYVRQSGPVPVNTRAM